MKHDPDTIGKKDPGQEWRFDFAQGREAVEPLSFAPF
jgi:hypothetical protein